MFEGGGDGGVAAGAAQGGLVVVEGVADEDVGEAQRAAGVGVGEESGVAGGVEGVEGGGFVAGEGDQQVGVDVAADDGGLLQDGAGGFAEPPGSTPSVNMRSTSHP